MPSVTLFTPELYLKPEKQSEIVLVSSSSVPAKTFESFWMKKLRRKDFE